MVGRSIDKVFPERQVSLGKTMLEVEDLSHPTEFDGLTFSLRQGEILGLYGLVGAGRSEAMQCLFGLTSPSARTGPDRWLEGRTDLPSASGRCRHRLCAGGSPDLRERFFHSACGRTSRWPRCARYTAIGGSVARPRTQRNAPPRRAPRGQGGQLGAVARRAFGRQPAEGGDREMARHASAHPHSRRAD